MISSDSSKEKPEFFEDYEPDAKIEPATIAPDLDQELIDLDTVRLKYE